jgi:N utilization substance protein B
MDKKLYFSGRKKARRYALQALYGWALSQNPVAEVEQHVLLEHAAEEFDKDYFGILLHEIPSKIENLEFIMSPHLSRKIEELGLIELTILRISVYELKERSDIPYRVVINEALELAKTFGAPDSHKFVNGVLDKIAKQLRIAEISNDGKL